MQTAENESVSPGPKRHSSRNALILILFIFGVILCVGIVVILGGSYNEYRQSPKLVQGTHLNPSALKKYTLAPDQADVVAKYGYPDSFTITFYKEEFAPDFTGEVRDEIWRYYKDGLALSFYEGILVDQETISDPPASWVVLPYHPDQFFAYANLESVLATASINDYFELPLEKELVENGNLYYAPGLTFGTVNDRLVYVETIMMQEEGE
jgi:hypothetical protein